jgi:uncharacterized OsmC-like protein
LSVVAPGRWVICPRLTGRYAVGGIRESIELAIHRLAAHPDEARAIDPYARAGLAPSLRVEVEGPAGEHLTTDMPVGLGGKGEAPTPGWMFRAAIASCVASTIGMESARDGLTLSSLEVEVDSESDDRGIFGMDASVPAGPLFTRLRIRCDADGVTEERLRDIIDRGLRRSPVLDAARRTVDVRVEIQVL